jgi:hypothetical protein
MINWTQHLAKPVPVSHRTTQYTHQLHPSPSGTHEDAVTASCGLQHSTKFSFSCQALLILKHFIVLSALITDAEEKKRLAWRILWFRMARNILRNPPSNFLVFPLISRLVTSGFLKLLWHTAGTLHLGYTKISKSFTQKIHIRNSETTVGCTVELHRDALGTAKKVHSNSCEHDGAPTEQT